MLWYRLSKILDDAGDHRKDDTIHSSSSWSETPILRRSCLGLAVVSVLRHARARTRSSRLDHGLKCLVDVDKGGRRHPG